MTKRVYLSLALFFIILGSALIFPSRVLAAGKLTLEPASGSLMVNGTLKVKIQIDTGADKTTSADAYITYNSNQLEIVSIEDGGFYSNLFKNISASRIYVGGAETQPLSTKTGTGTLAILTIKGKQKGTAQLTFNCTAGETNESNITKNDANATDIIDCSATTGGSYTITAGGENESPSPTPIPTSASTQTKPTPTPALPTTGFALPTILSLGSGTVLLAFASLRFLLLK